MPRLFTGLEIPADVAMDLALMRGGIPGARWIDQESCHITLRFIGDIEEGLAAEVAAAFWQLQPDAFTLQLKGVDVFGGNKPHSLHVNVVENGALRRLQAAQERLCQMTGLAPESRKFVPHVTLARLSPGSTGALHQYLASHNLYASRPFEVTRFVLFSSRPARGGGPYAIEEVYDFAAGINFAEDASGP